MNELKQLREEFFDGDWVSNARLGWNDDNTKGYQFAKKDFERLLNKFLPEPSLCPLTNSSHEKALVRVVEKELTGGTEPISINVYKYKQDFIQVLCSCGHIISEAEIKSK